MSRRATLATGSGHLPPAATYSPDVSKIFIGQSCNLSEHSHRIDNLQRIGDFTTMRFINLRFTYFLTYLYIHVTVGDRSFAAAGP